VIEVDISILRWFPHGGLQRDCLAVARACHDAGHRVRILTLRWDGPRPEGIAIEELPVPGRTNHARAEHFERAIEERAGDREERVRPVRLGFDKQSGLDLYFAGDPCRAKRDRRKHGLLARALPRDRTFARLERAVFAPDAPTRVLALTEAQVDEYVSEYGTPRDRIELLPPGLSVERVAELRAARDRERLRERLGLGPAPFLLCLGSDFRRKGFARAVEALAHVPEAVLWVVGDDDGNQLRRLTQRLGVADRVRVSPGRDDVAELLHAADVLVHPAHQEVAGMVIVEALTAGLPVVTTDSCGYAIWVERTGGGRVVGVDADAAVLGQATNAVLAQRDRLSTAALAWARTTDLGALHESVRAAVERVAEKRARLHS
jgi:UDP-glucose:(heptosyl)LPS alpha-1,3-glucosyltransferase